MSKITFENAINRLAEGYTSTMRLRNRHGKIPRVDVKRFAAPKNITPRGAYYLPTDFTKTPVSNLRIV